AYSIIKQGAEIGEGTLIADQVFIGANVKIGRACRLFPGVRIMHNCSLGDHCVVHPNTVIGSDGFGFAPQADGSYQKIPQVGNVIVEDEVEIGANVAIDRATMGSTIIRRGVKIDNLVQIAHNVEVGANTVIAGQAGIAGSTKIGKNCRIGGQVGFAGHLTIADGSNFQAQSGVMQSIKTENGRFFGTPIMGYTAFMKSSLALRDLPELVREINRLKKQLAILEDEVQS
ncbi:MAG: UDP-3-O-(3-hydroxymyristoyl)glucosamine N-acyltransferase, partial [Bacteroidota bacterium]